MGFIPFTAACVLTMPKQLLVVYLGTLFDTEESQRSTASKIASYVGLGVGFFATIYAAWYLYREMARVRPIVLQARACVCPVFALVLL